MFLTTLFSAFKSVTETKESPISYEQCKLPFYSTTPNF